MNERDPHVTLDPNEPGAPAAPAAVAPATAAGPSPVPVVAVAPRARSGGILNLLLIGAAIVAIGGVAFAVGRSTAPAVAFQPAGAFDGGNVTGPRGSFAPGAGGPGAFSLGGAITLDGTVKSIDADSLTLTLADGQEMTFKLDDATTYREATDATATDIAVGDQVSVKAAGDGRIQAGGDGGAPDLTAGDVTVAR
jgi:hypothetical protein